MSKFPNSSVLNLITRDNESGYFDIMFICTKVVPDFFEHKMEYWYPGRGQKGHAVLVWQSQKMRQWLAHGTDEVIENIFNQIIVEGEISIDGKKINFVVPKFNKVINTPDPFFDRNQSETELFVTENLSFFPPEFLVENNLEILSGYHPAEKGISALSPAGLFDKEYLPNRIPKGQFGEKDRRRPYLTYHGRKQDNSETNDLRLMTGFYQVNFGQDDIYQAKFKDKNGSFVGSGEINHSNGIFQVRVSDNSGKGAITISLNGTLLQSQRFTLIKDIKFSIDPTSALITDVYGKIHSTHLTADVKFSPFSWQRDMYASLNDANQMLSNRFQNLIQYLGSNILIADPYFINDIKDELTTCQLSLLNAIAISSVQNGIKKLTFLGVNGRANQHFDKKEELDGTTTEQRFQKYRNLFDLFIGKNNLSKYLEPKTIQFNSAISDFHNRYWFSFSEDCTQLKRCIIVTNSIGNMAEVDFIEVTDETQLRQLTSKYFNLYQHSKNELTI